METRLDAINRQIKAENNRHSTVINDLDKRKNQENTLHQQRLQQLNNQKEQIKRSMQNTQREDCNFKELNKLLKDFVED